LRCERIRRRSRWWRGRRRCSSGTGRRGRNRSGRSGRWCGRRRRCRGRRRCRRWGRRWSSGRWRARRRRWCRSVSRKGSRRGILPGGLSDARIGDGDERKCRADEDEGSHGSVVQMRNGVNFFGARSRGAARSSPPRETIVASARCTSHSISALCCEILPMAPR
jgi:hypothetical protein